MIVSICGIHGELKEIQCLKIKKKYKIKSGQEKSFFSYTCLKCRAITTAKYRRNNPEKIKQQSIKRNISGKANLSARKSSLKRKYNITLEHYDKLLKKQNNLCAICGQIETCIDIRYNKVRILSIDHCHASEIKGIIKIRGLLCSRCNLVLGRLNDSIELSEKFTEYLKEHA